MGKKAIVLDKNQISPYDLEMIYNNLGDYFGRNQDIESFQKYWDFTPSNGDVKRFFDSYLDSPGFKRIIKNQNNWWRSRHPYRKFYSNPDPEDYTKKWFEDSKTKNPKMFYFNGPGISSFYGRGTKTPEDNGNVFIGTMETEKFPKAMLEGHEWLHGINPNGWFGLPRGFAPNSAQGEALSQNTNTKITGFESMDSHDSKEDEKHADIWGLKYLFYKEKIYDTRGNKDITLDQVKQLRKKYPKLRPFLQMTDEQVMFMMNNVAQNDGPNQHYNDYYTT